ncbi:MAG: surface lipoprotein assembly modifier, partial [Proteobacteria bacterium]|nr:surface lipoprotein assembly modifier [Pseudomonadota bacterium]
GFAQARLEYAALLADRGQRRDALAQLNHLSRSVSDPTSRETLDNVIDTIEAQGRPRFQFFAALIEDTNVNSGTDATTYTLFGLPFAVAPAARRTEARGLRFGGTMTVDRPLGPGALGYAALRLTFEDFEGSRFDRQIADIRLGLRRDVAGGRGSIGVELLGERLLRETGSDEAATGLRAYGRWALSDRTLLSLDATARNRDYDLVPGLVRQERSATLRADHLLARPGWAVWGAVGIIEEEADATPSTGFDGHLLELGVTGRFDFGLSASLGVKRTWRDFDAIFPGQPVPRADKATEVSLTLWSPKVSVRGLQPRMGLIWTDQASNVTLHDFHRLQGSLFLTRSF